jgi:hypothetical protein
VPVEGFGERPDLGPQTARGQLGQGMGVVVACNELFDHGPPGLGEHFRSHRGELDAGVLEDLFQALDLLRAHDRQALAIAG